MQINAAHNSDGLSRLVETKIFNLTGNIAASLPDVAPGRIIDIGDSATGLTRYTVDGTNPTATNGAQVSGNSKSVSSFWMKDLSQFTITTTNAAGRTHVVYEVYS